MKCISSTNFQSVNTTEGHSRLQWQNYGKLLFRKFEIRSSEIFDTYKNCDDVVEDPTDGTELLNDVVDITEPTDGLLL